MIITSEILDNKLTDKIKIFKDTTCLISLVNTEGNLGVVCYLDNNCEGNKEKSVSNSWKPFSLSETQNIKVKAKTYRELINNTPLLKRDNVSNIKGKFYNTFDTPVEVNNEILTTTFEIFKQDKNSILERKTYYLIIDVQELERTFNANIMPCEIINFNDINDLFEGKPVDECLKVVVSRLN